MFTDSTDTDRQINHPNTTPQTYNKFTMLINALGTRTQHIQNNLLHPKRDENMQKQRHTTSASLKLNYALV